MASQGPARKNPMGCIPRAKRLLEDLTGSQGSAPSSSITAQPNDQEIRERYQKSCMAEQGALVKIEYKKEAYKKWKSDVIQKE